MEFYVCGETENPNESLKTHQNACGALREVLETRSITHQVFISFYLKKSSGEETLLGPKICRLYVINFCKQR